MNDYEKNLFHGECPFNGKKCDKDIDCIKCKIEHKERKLMTREEAIAYGKRVIDLGLNDETQAFCQTAIQVLEQEPLTDDTGIKLDEAIKRYDSNAEFERTHGNLQGCLEFRQLAKWLRELKMCRHCGVKMVETQERE